MAAIDQLNAQQGLKPQPKAAQSARTTPASTTAPLSEPFHHWFPRFLADELRPYPGRVNLVLRYTVAAVIVMLIIITFRIPGASSGGFFVFLVPRDSPRAALRGGLASIAAYVSGLAFVLAGALLFVDYPLTHFLWVVVSFFIAFYSISALSNYGAATAFAISIVLSIPVWDTPAPQSAIIVSNLYTGLSVVLAIIVGILTEYAFSVFYPKDELTQGLETRLNAVHTLLSQSARLALTPGKQDPAGRPKVNQLAIIGVSRLRRLALSDSITPADRPRQSTAVSHVGRLIDILAAYQHFDSFTPEDAPRLKAFADQVALLEHKLTHPRDPAITPLPPNPEQNPPLILEGLEQTLELLRISLSPDPGQSFQLDAFTAADPPLFKPGAFSNPEHLHFALRGTLAAVLCYFLYTAVFWSLGTSLFTCIVTALSSIGASRQKQLLRFSGATFGGVILGIGSQVFLLPMLDTIAGFTLMFAVVTAIAAWILTSSPRLSYFGTQMALGFYTIQLRGSFPQTDLGIARDSILGILLGLVMMGLVFETLGSKPAVQVMRELFAENLKLMSHLARPWPDGRPADIRKIRTLRDKISENFTSVNAQADAVLFETGRNRARSLAVRERLLGLQPQFRSLFLMQVALLQYRLQIQPNEIPPGVLDASIRFDNELSAMLQTIAGNVTRHPATYPVARIRTAYTNLKDAIDRGFGDHPTLRSRAVLAILEQAVDLSTHLLGELTHPA